MENRTIIKIVGGLVLCFSLQSCFVAKKYTRPQIETQDLFGDVSATDSTTLANMPWQQLFPDPHLKELITMTLDQNPDVQMAFERVNAAQAYYKQGKAGYLPTLSVKASASKLELSDNSFSGVAAGGNAPHYDNYQLNGLLSWEADVWGKIRSNKRAAQAGYLQSEAALRTVQTRLIAGVASAYYQLMALDAQYQVVQKTVRNRKESLRTMKDLKDAGRVTQAAVKQTEAQLYAAQILEIDIENNSHLLENTISMMMGNAPIHITRGNLFDQKIQEDLPTGLPAQLLRNRPDIMVAEYGLVRSFEMTNVARSSFYPSFTLSAGGGFESIEFEDWFNSKSIFSNLAAGLVQPIFNKRRNRTQLEVAKAQQQEAMHNFKKSLLQAGKEVSDALLTYESESSKYEIRQKELSALNDAVSYSEELLNNGYATYLEVLTARDHALASEINTIDTRFKQLNSIINLYQALGGGWK